MTAYEKFCLNVLSGYTIAVAILYLLGEPFNPAATLTGSIIGGIIGKFYCSRA